MEPPRGRGKVRGRKPFLQEPWITPAWAGKSIRASRCSFGIEDHPRVGGEKFFKNFISLGQKGSPPRGRGKVDAMERAIVGTRITPAWAGKSRTSAVWRNWIWDHPRVGGEKRKGVILWHGEAGSPPRGRGKDDLPADLSGGAGITPAWAGKSSFPPDRSVTLWDHPRVGGEKTCRELPHHG